MFADFPETVGSRVLEVSQGSVIESEGYITTATPRGVYWLAAWGRSMLGREKLSLQTIWVDEDMVDDAGATIFDVSEDKFMGDLGGNSFSTVNVMPCVLALLVTLAWLESFKFTVQISSVDWTQFLEGAPP